MTTFTDPGESPCLARVLLLPEQLGLASLLTALQLHPPKSSRVAAALGVCCWGHASHAACSLIRLEQYKQS